MRRKTPSVSDQHQDWLGQVETEGPFLSLPVLKDIWPQGVERLGEADDRMITFKQAYVQWQRAFDDYTQAANSDAAKARYDYVDRAWIELVLDQLAGWQDLRIITDDPRLADLMITSPGGEITVRPSGAIKGRDAELGALLLVSAPTTDLRAVSLDGWAATEIDRMAMLLRKARVEVGVVTDGQWWAIVWAKDGKPTGSGMVNALTWAEEPLLRDAFLTLIDQRRFRAKDPAQRLPHLFERSELEAEEITEALGTQVRKSVELLVQAFSEARLVAAEAGHPDPLTDKPDDVYQAAVTIMMRVVFLLFAEERDMLPTEQLYWNSYAISDLLDDLQHRAAEGEEHLDETYDAWHRLLAVSQALYEGVNYDEMRMPAYGGSLLDPVRFPWLHATDGHGLQLLVSDRVMLHVFDSMQSVVVKNERRRISFRDIDVEQIGYIYEGLLGYTCLIVEDDIVLGLVGKHGEEPEIPLGPLQQLYDDSADSKAFAISLLAWVKEHQPSATSKAVSAIAKLAERDLTKDSEAELTRLLTPIAGRDQELLAQLVSWGNLIRRDLRDIPYVVPVGGLIVGETPSRKNAGAHYTPRSLAEEVVKYALEPLVYEPGPLQTDNERAWKLKSSTAILDLKVADIAVGSGAFLVAAARFLADRVTEAWTDEGMLGVEEQENPKLATDRAIREVIARCLYGADINPMAVEMCKLSLWLVSMDKTKPFSFVDDKIFCGNSLLGITSLDQLRALHIYPDPERQTDLLQELIDVDGKIAEAIRLRKELASPIDEHNPMRSTRGKTGLLRQLRNVTVDLRLIADGVIGAGLPLGGKSGSKLDDAYAMLSWEFAQALQPDASTNMRLKVEGRVEQSLVPTVKTDYAHWEPLHWILEAPDVILERGGFDAVVGNPPFLGGKKVSSATGRDLRDWLIEHVADGAKGNADIVAYFLLRAQSLLSGRGCLGLIATNTVAQGDTREVGLDQIVRKTHIRRCTRSKPWPAESAQLEYAAIWASVRPNEGGQCVADGTGCARISALLEPEGRVAGLPIRLGENRGRAWVGSNVNGTGFVMSVSECAELIQLEAQSSLVLKRYIRSDEVNGSPTHDSSAMIVDFGEMSEQEASRYAAVWEWVARYVKPHRLQLAHKPRLRRIWWQYERSAKGLYERISRLPRVIAFVQTSKTQVPVLIDPADAVFTHKIVVVSTDSRAELSVLTSSFHWSWIIQRGSSMKSDSVYTPTDVYQTFPQPKHTPSLDRVGTTLDTERRELMVRRGLGLTHLYNLVSDLRIQGDDDVDRMREIHVEVDVATIAAYGWQDVPLNHGFHTYRQMRRWTISPAARVEILDRLLELNHQRAREEGQGVPDQGELF